MTNTSYLTLVKKLDVFPTWKILRLNSRINSNKCSPLRLLFELLQTVQWAFASEPRSRGVPCLLQLHQLLHLGRKGFSITGEVSWCNNYFTVCSTSVNECPDGTRSQEFWNTHKTYVIPYHDTCPRVCPAGVPNYLIGSAGETHYLSPVNPGFQD